jgi:transcriptional regulator with XRE-family HTH domain
MSVTVKTQAESDLDPRELLRAELAERCRRNPRYSLRAFARASGVSHTVLSLVLAGKRPLSRKAAERLADYLNLDPDRRRALLRPSRERAGLPTAPGCEYRQLSLDAFDLISDWHHLAILSALELPDARFEARSLSRSPCG